MISTLDILTHLYSSYGRLTAQDLYENDQKMRTPFDASLPIELLFDQIQDGRDMAAHGNSPYTLPQILNIAYNLVQATGLYGIPCKEWRRFPHTKKTWVIFRIHFAEAAHELRTDQGTANNNGYGTVNHVEQNEFMQDTATAISSLAKSVQADSAAFAKMQEQLTELVKIVTALQIQSKSEPKRQSGNSRKTNKKKYCWTHGFQHSHESPKCKYPLEAHEKDATAENTMGGCQTGK